MDNLEKLEELLKAFKTAINTAAPKTSSLMMKPNNPKIPSMSPKIPGIGPKSKKDPVKVAEQIKNPSIKTIVMDGAKQMKETLKISKNGQWKL
jgi:hypothetical protein